jgi:hypothetical protein
LRRSIGRYIGAGREPGSWDAASQIDVADILTSGLRQFYTPPPLPGERSSWEWSFLTPQTTLSVVAPYETGTVAIAAGVVTLSVAGTFPSWAAAADLEVDDGVYSVATRDGDNQVTLDDTSVTVAAGETYSLKKSAYDLPSGFGGFEGPVTYQPGSSVTYPPIEEVSEAQVRGLLVENYAAAPPEIVAVRPKTLDYTTGTRYEAIFYPTTDGDYTLYYRYRVDVSALSATNQYPPGGQDHAETILESCLAAAEKMLNDGQTYHQALFLQRLAASVSRDRQLSSPPYLGRLQDGRDNETFEDGLHNWDHIVTYEGVTA